jgi:NAD(P)-dependent dehydrogenase (short-subunit alcohol dehydrogenase family)
MERNLVSSHDATGTRVAVVTGGASGIGRVVAERLSEGGFQVVIADRDEAGAKAVAEELKAQHGLVDPRGLDVLDRGGIDEFWHWLVEEHGRCDVLVNSAGVAWLRPFSDLDVAEWDTTFGVNVTGAMLMAQHASGLMVQHRWGRIVNVTSVSGLRASVGRTAYGSSKAALTGLTRQLAIELAEHNVTVNAVAPGPVTTPLAESAHSQATRDAYNRVIPMKRYATSKDVAAAVAFFTSEEAGYITGHTLPVDGGYMAAGILDA